MTFRCCWIFSCFPLLHTYCITCILIIGGIAFLSCGINCSKCSLHEQGMGERRQLSGSCLKTKFKKVQAAFKALKRFKKQPAHSKHTEKAV